MLFEAMNILAWENRYMGIHLQLLEQLYRELFACESEEKEC